MYANNPAYQLQKTIGKYSIYTAKDINDGIHIFRYIEAQAQERYNRAGITAENLETIADEILKRANEKNFEQARTDIGVIATSLKYRLKFPVDEHCALRMGHILTFMEHEDGTFEDPKSTHIAWMDKKMELSLESPDAYAFFLNLGLASSETYSKISDISIDTDYFLRRRMELASLRPSAKK